MISLARLGLPPAIETEALLNGSSIGFLRGLRFAVAALFNDAVLAVPANPLFRATYEIQGDYLAITAGIGNVTFPVAAHSAPRANVVMNAGV